MKVWNENSTTGLQDCFECTDWDVFRHSCGTLDEHNDAVTTYVPFCVDKAVPVKPCKIYPNNKPWISRRLRGVLNKKKTVYFQAGMEKKKKHCSKGGKNCNE